LCKKDSKTNQDKDGNTGAGQIDGIYTFLEESGYYYISLLARCPALMTSGPADPGCKSILFNESRIGNVTGQEDMVVTSVEDHDIMLQIGTKHRMALKIPDTKEMMVGVAYGMRFELDQFRLFHISLQIDATSDTKKEGRPLVTVTYKDSYGCMFFVLQAFLPCEQNWAYKWLFHTVFPVLIGSDVLNKGSIVITDDDSQETTQLEDAVNKFTSCA
jgi:hypothetical protein